MLCSLLTARSDNDWISHLSSSIVIINLEKNGLSISSHNNANWFVSKDIRYIRKDEIISNDEHLFRLNPTSNMEWYPFAILNVLNNWSNLHSMAGGLHFRNDVEC